jgi:pyruvate ferredoxin oxidoreductase gamma subunit
MPFYTGLKRGGVILINSKTPIAFSKDEQREMEENEAKVYYVPCTEMANEIAKTDLATNMAMCGAIAAVFGMPDMKSLAESVKDRFIGKGIVVSGGTAALDSAIEKKFAKKAKLLEANMKTLHATYKYVMDQGWAHKEAALEELDSVAV